MTNKEAIEILLKSQIFLARNCGKSDMYNAVELALIALEERPQAITNEDIKSAINEGFKNGYEMAKAKYERPTGEWTTAKGSLEITCSVCHKSYFYHPKNDFYYDFCPNCGADMRVKDELNNELKDELNELGGRE